MKVTLALVLSVFCCVHALVDVYPHADDLIQRINANPPGTSYFLHPGLHRVTSPVVLKQNDRIYGREATISAPLSDCVQIQKNGIQVHGLNVGPCAGRGILIQGASDVTVSDNYIHPEFPIKSCCDSADGMYISKATNVLVRGNVIAYGETNIEITGSTNITVEGNFLLNPLGPFPRGQQVQSWDGNSKIYVLDNYALSSTNTSKYKFAEVQEDAINFGPGSGFHAIGNWIEGGHSPSGCGLIADDGADNCLFENNTLYHTGQCGIGIASGVNTQVIGNRILNTFINTPNAGNTAMYVWKQYKDHGCGPTTVKNNILYATKPDGSPSSYWNGGGCEPVTQTGNVFDNAAFEALNPIFSKFPPPTQIPPKPLKCTAKSPYSVGKTTPLCE